MSTVSAFVRERNLRSEPPCSVLRVCLVNYIDSDFAPFVFLVEDLLRLLLGRLRGSQERVNMDIERARYVLPGFMTLVLWSQKPFLGLSLVARVMVLVWEVKMGFVVIEVGCEVERKLEGDGTRCDSKFSGSNLTTECFEDIPLC